MNRVYALAIVLGALVIASPSGAAPNPGANPLVRPRTLVIEKGQIYKFAQDGDFIAWIGGRKYKIHVRRASKRIGWVLGTAAPHPNGFVQEPSALVLGGKRAVWVNVSGVMSPEANIITSKPGQRGPTLVDTPTLTDDGGGTHLTGLAADGEKTIVYGTASVEAARVGGGFAYSLSGGGVHRIIGGHKSYPPPIAGIPPAFAIAASQGRVAVVPAVVPDPSRGDVEAALNGPVDVYSLSGTRLTHVVPAGTAREVALSWPDLAVLVKRMDGTTALEHYDAGSGALLTSTNVPGASSSLAIGSGGIVFLVNKRINTIRAGRPALLWRSTGYPIGLSIEGRRVAWAVNGRIRSLNLPR
jgi:hypothetical protein